LLPPSGGQKIAGWRIYGDSKATYNGGDIDSIGPTR
jgi:hypothetical protein